MIYHCDILIYQSQILNHIMNCWYENHNIVVVSHAEFGNISELKKYKYQQYKNAFL